MNLKEKQDYLQKNVNLCCACRNKETCLYRKQFNAKRVEYWYNHGIYFMVDKCIHYREEDVE